MDEILPTDKELMEMGLIYQDGGKYPREAQRAEDHYLHEHILDISQKCIEWNELHYPEYMPLEEEIGAQRGMWQGRYGFYRTITVIRRLEKEEIVDLARQCFDEDMIQDWLAYPNDKLDGLTPNEFIEADKSYRVIRLLKLIKDGLSEETCEKS